MNSGRRTVLVALHAVLGRAYDPECVGLGRIVTDLHLSQEFASRNNVLVSIQPHTS